MKDAHTTPKRGVNHPHQPSGPTPGPAPILTPYKKPAHPTVAQEVSKQAKLPALLQQRPPDRWFSRQSYLPRYRLGAPASEWPFPNTRFTGELPVGMEAPGPLPSGSHHQVPSRPPGAFSGNGRNFALHPVVHNLVTWKALSPSHSRTHLGFRCGSQFSAAGFLWESFSQDTGSSNFSGNTCAF